MYARTLLDCATANADGRARALVVGGGIANFTDVAATFKGIIQVWTSDYRTPGNYLSPDASGRNVIESLI